ncbi:MAG: hypothetical protein HYY23_14545 [Verrucomicrobia bacterium]|nr:hypothetical protein [Verrucomicrobiota bacterium]
MVLLLCFCIYVWGQIDPSLQYQAAGRTFILGAEFLKSYLTRPGGMTEYATVFLAQFNQVAWLGALGLTLGAWSVLSVTRHLLDGIAALRLGPVFFLLLLANQYDSAPWQTVLELFLSLSFALGYVALPGRRVGVRFAAFAPGALLLYHLAGAGPCFLYGSLCALFEFARTRHFLVGASSLCMTWAIPFVAGFLSGVDLSDSFKHWGTGVPFWLAVAFYLFFPITAWLAWVGNAKRRSGKEDCVPPQRELIPLTPSLSSREGEGVRRTGEGDFIRLLGRDQVKADCFMLALFLLMLGLALLTFDRNRKARMEVDQLAERGRWNEVLATAAKLHETSLFSALQVDRALFHSGRMGDELFAFRRFKGLDLLPGLDKGLEHCRALSATLLDLGHVNLAEHFAHEALELEGERPVLLWLLARINVLKDRPDAARVFLNLLQKIPFQREAAGRWLCALEADPQLRQQQDLAQVRSRMVAVDEPEGGLLTETLLEQLLQANRRNRMAFEYLMAHCLLTFQLDKLVQNLGRLDDFDCPTIPTHYEEAILLRQRFKGEIQIDLRSRKISSKSVEKFARFQAQMDRFQNRREEARTALVGEFGDTYWYYFLFARTAGQKATAVQESEQ